AAEVLREARRQAANYAREEVGPRIASGFASARGAASAARERLSDDVLPVISRRIGSALAALEAARDPRVRDVVRKVSRAGQRAGIVTPPRQTPGPGTFILIGLGVVAAAAVAYAAWQTIRSDDSLWI